MNYSDDDNNIHSLLAQAYAGRINNLSNSIALAEKALLKSRDKNDKSLVAKSLSHLSLFYMIMGEYAKSMSMSEEALIYFKELNDEKGIADAKYNIAGLYYKSDNFHLGLTNLIDCLVIYRKYNDYHNEARVQKSLGTIYEYFGDQKNAISAYEGSVEAARKTGDISLESNAYNPLSGIYLKHGQIGRALNTIEQAIAMKKLSNDVRGLAFSLYGRGKIYTKTRQFADAEEDFKNALSIHNATGERLGAAMAYRKLGEMYIAMGDIEKAKISLKQALEVCEKYNIAIIRFKTNYHLYQVYKLENDTVNAIAYLEKYVAQKEAVINAQTVQVIENYELIKRMELLERETSVQKEKAEIIEKKNLAEQASRVKQDFLSTMSHEIRTPLNAVTSIISLLKDRTDPEEQQLLNSLKFSANNLLRIINDILDFSKLESGKSMLELRPIKLQTLLDNLKHTYEGLAREKGLKLLLVIDPAIAESYELDETKLTQILGNLISNAIKFTETGEITLEVQKNGNDGIYDLLNFKVADTGIGISESNLDKIFETFSQPQSITTRKQGGSGLGLAIVRKLVLLHGSDIQVSSIEKKGSCFSFELKLKKETVKDNEQVLQKDLLKDKTLLLAEDNMINAMVATKLLSKWGVKTELAKNGLEAVEKSKTKPFDYILMDIHMPEMNGFDATKHIRESGNPNARTPIFAFTADITTDQNTDYNAYFNGFLLKPIEIDKMYDALANI